MAYILILSCVILITSIATLGIFGEYKLIKYYNYELNFKESIIFCIASIILNVWYLLDKDILKVQIGTYLLILYFYLIILLIIYYAMRSRKLKVYVPSKIILNYIFMSGINLIIIFNLVPNLQSVQFNEWNGMLNSFFIFLVYLAILGIFIFAILYINMWINTVNSNKNKQSIYDENINYKLNNFYLINVFYIVSIIFSIYGTDFYNSYNLKKYFAYEEKVVQKYLQNHYNNYDFKILETSKTKVNCGGEASVCSTKAIQNKIKEITTNQEFYVYVRQEDMSIYEVKFYGTSNYQ